ncbi:triose-phosphate isomerase [Sinisalibacter lacisalsi]|uniref:Triosephosphate isomerase n=1 Tax=Sinisalibacter lacisalsi TaxID=1526570 RepID=A0ABQ1QMV8_9RHOB|nr:triose-phosphate isomerase [Sinisalibacter lacisalsi]GGD32444.1 triosephosphate isomerase [Sinisalibacter lacisalsi]
MRRGLAAGNWKMNGTAASLGEVEVLKTAHPAPAVDILICPPATLLERLSSVASGSAIATGGQDCHPEKAGAHTGDIAAGMIADAGGSHAIVGHSERRADHHETDAIVRAKAEAALAAGLVAVICLGESLDQRESDQTLDVIGAQLAGSLPDGLTGANAVIAYEPIWAIGTGKIPTIEQITEVHDFIRAELVARFGAEGEAIRVLYGGSVKPSNAAEIFAVANVDGALVGGASLKAEDFSPIIAALETAKG